MTSCLWPEGVSNYRVAMSFYFQPLPFMILILYLAIYVFALLCSSCIGL